MQLMTQISINEQYLNYVHDTQHDCYLQQLATATIYSRQQKSTPREKEINQKKKKKEEISKNKIKKEVKYK